MEKGGKDGRRDWRVRKEERDGRASGRTTEMENASFPEIFREANRNSSAGRAWSQRK